MPFNKPIEQWTETDLELLIEAGVEESSHIEYKREIDLSGNGKKEAAKDLSAMANATGGIVIYGIDEKRDGKNAGIPTQLCPMADPALVERLEAVLLSSVSPRLGFTMRRIDARQGGYYLAVSIPQSHANVHMVTLGGDNRFYRRRNHMSSRMAEDEVSLAYEMVNRSKETVESRLQATKLSVPDQWFGWQLTSVPAVDLGRLIDPRRVSPHELYVALANAEGNRLGGLSAIAPVPSHGPDGFHYSQDDSAGLYNALQIMYSGGISRIASWVLRHERWVPTKSLLDDVHDTMLQFASVYRHVGFHGPVRLTLTLHGVKGTRIPRGPGQHRESNELEQDALVIDADTIVDAMVHSSLSVVREIMDHVFFSYGLDGCRYFEKDRDTLKPS